MEISIVDRLQAALIKRSESASVAPICVVRGGRPVPLEKDPEGLQWLASTLAEILVQAITNKLFSANLNTAWDGNEEHGDGEEKFS